MTTVNKTNVRLLEFAEVFQKSIEQHNAFCGSDVGRRVMALKVGMCLIRYDLVRYIYEFNTLNLPVYAKTRAYADAIRVMVEGKDWIEKKANGELRKICEKSGLGTDLHTSLSKKCKRVFSLSKISKYEDYRHALSGHYDLNIPEFMQKFCGIDAIILQEDTRGFADYLNQWVRNLVDVFESHNKANSADAKSRAAD